MCSSKRARTSLALVCAALPAWVLSGCADPTPRTPVTGVIAGQVLVVGSSASGLSAKPAGVMRSARAHIAATFANGTPLTTTTPLPTLPSPLLPTLPVTTGPRRPATPTKMPMEWRPGEALVLFKGQLRDAGFTRARAFAVLEGTRARAHLDDVRLELGSCAGRRFCHVLMKSTTGAPITLDDTTRVARALQAAKPEGVVAIARNFVRHGLRAPNDEFSGFQWNYRAARLFTAWDLIIGDPNLIVAVVDSGLVQAHPDISARAIPGMDLIEDATSGLDGNGRDTNPEDPGDGAGPNGESTFHGTHVAGTIGAETDNTEGVAGVMWEGKIEPVRVLGQGLGGVDSDIIPGILWAVGETDIDGVPNNPQPARLVNLSLGGPSDADAQAIWEDVVTEVTADVDGRFGKPILVTAAGNEDQPASAITPGNIASMITVGATRFDGARASYSDFGDAVDLMAPGGETALDQNADGFGDGVLSLVGGTRNYDFDQGTSMAAPHVTGIAGLLLSVDPTLNQAAVQNILTKTANTSSKCSAGCGAGLVDAAAALIEAGAVIVPEARLSIDTSLAFIGPGLTTTTISITNLGTADLPFVARLSGPQSSLFTVSPATGIVPSATAVALVVTVQRNGDAAGAAALEILGQGDAASQTGGVSVQFNDGPPRSTQVETVAVAAFQKQADGSLAQVGDSVFARRADGYVYELPGLAPGDYFIFGVGDDNADGAFDTALESFGAYPIADAPTVITVAAGKRTDGISFGLTAGFVVNDVGAAGAPCSADADCTFIAGAECIVDFTGGYCSRICDDGNCGAGAQCATLDCGGTACNVCLATCAAQSQCRVGDGFQCDTFGTCTPAAAGF